MSTTPAIGSVPGRPQEPEEQGGAPAPQPAPRRALDQSVQVAWVANEVREDLGGLGFVLHFPSDSAVAEVFSQLGTLRGDELREVLAGLDRDGKLDRLIAGLDEGEQERFLHLLSKQGVLTETELSWKAGTWGVSPPPRFDGQDLPPALRNLVDVRNARAENVMQGRADALRDELAAAPPSKDVPRREALQTKSLARSPEESARFALGARPSMEQLLRDPIQAVRDGAQWAAAQTDVQLRTKSLAVGDEVEVRLGSEDQHVKAVLARTGQQAWELTLSVEAMATLFGGELEADLEGLELAVGARQDFGFSGDLTLAVDSPEQLTQLLTALRSHRELSCSANRRDLLETAVAAKDFVQAHLKSGAFAVKTESEVEVGGSLGKASAGAVGKVERGVEFERTFLDDGRVATTVKQELQTTAKASLSLGLKLAEGEDLTRLTVETTAVTPAKPGEKPTMTVVVLTRLKQGARVDTRKLEIAVPPEKETAFREAIASMDQAAMKALLAEAKRELTTTTAYEEKLPFGVGHSINRRQVAARKEEL